MGRDERDLLNGLAHDAIGQAGGLSRQDQVRLGELALRAWGELHDAETFETQVAELAAVRDDEELRRLLEQPCQIRPGMAARSDRPDVPETAIGSVGASSDPSRDETLTELQRQLAQTSLPEGEADPGQFAEMVELAHRLAAAARTARNVADRVAGELALWQVTLDVLFHVIDDTLTPADWPDALHPAYRAAHALDVLGRYRPDELQHAAQLIGLPFTAPAPTHRHVVRRRDDHGTVFDVETFETHDAAQDRLAALETGHHRQTYWIETLATGPSDG